MVTTITFTSPTVAHLLFSLSDDVLEWSNLSSREGPPRYDTEQEQNDEFKLRCAKLAEAGLLALVEGVEGYKKWCARSPPGRTMGWSALKERVRAYYYSLILLNKKLINVIQENKQIRTHMPRETTLPVILQTCEAMEKNRPPLTAVTSGSSG